MYDKNSSGIRNLGETVMKNGEVCIEQFLAPTARDHTSRGFLGNPVIVSRGFWNPVITGFITVLRGLLRGLLRGFYGVCPDSALRGTQRHIILWFPMISVSEVHNEPRILRGSDSWLAEPRKNPSKYHVFHGVYLRGLRGFFRGVPAPLSICYRSTLDAQKS